MNINRVYDEFVFRLNKLGTNSNQNVQYPQFVSLINKAQLHWVEQRIKVKEQNQIRSEELQRLLKDHEATPPRQENFYRLKLPVDYFRYERLYAPVKGCKSVVYGMFREEGNMNALLQNAHTKPSSAWEEVLVTVFDKSLRIYVDNFSLDKIHLKYFRLPTMVDIAGYLTNGKPSKNIDLEFEHVDAHEIIDLAVQIATGDIQDPGRYQTITRHIAEHN